MTTALIVADMLWWMYVDAPKAFLAVWKDLLWFVYHFFSIPLHARTLFARWKQLGEVPQRRSLEDWASALLVNTLMRIVGAGIRLLAIVFGLAALLGGIVIGAICFLLWLLMPLVIVGCFIFGLILLVA